MTEVTLYVDALEVTNEGESERSYQGVIAVRASGISDSLEVVWTTGNFNYTEEIAAEKQALDRLTYVLKGALNE